jgi:hypothetical protein
MDQRLNTLRIKAISARIRWFYPTLSAHLAARAQTDLFVQTLVQLPPRERLVLFRLERRLREEETRT